MMISNWSEDFFIIMILLYTTTYINTYLLLPVQIFSGGDTREMEK